MEERPRSTRTRSDGAPSASQRTERPERSRRRILRRASPSPRPRGDHRRPRSRAEKAGDASCDRTQARAPVVNNPEKFWRHSSNSRVRICILHRLETHLEIRQRSVACDRRHSASGRRRSALPTTRYDRMDSFPQRASRATDLASRASDRDPLHALARHRHVVVPPRVDRRLGARRVILVSVVWRPRGDPPRVVVLVRLLARLARSPPPRAPRRLRHRRRERDRRGAG